jgi:tRNA-splicing ligase RtcB
MMIEIRGAHNTAICYTDEIEPSAMGQIIALCNRPEYAESRIRIMPDVHAGIGCTIGTTMTIQDRVVPGMVGVDIGCGMQTVELSAREIDLEKLDAVIREHIPAGRNVRPAPHSLNDLLDLAALRCAGVVRLDRARHSIGTLGSGNHFIEVDRDEAGTLYLVVHSGSRSLGSEVAAHYQREAQRRLNTAPREAVEATVARLKAEGRHKEINAALTKLKNAARQVPPEFAYVEGEMFDDYLHDMRIVQAFAEVNRLAMVEIILQRVGLDFVDRFQTVHNYIDMEYMVLRKGAVSAWRGERLLIPINMRDGSLLCVGLGNADWNHSAPHGAGRLMSRRQAKDTLSMEEYRAEMAGVYTTCVTEHTLDESPMAYKGLEQIVDHIAPTAKIMARLRPVYNFKAAE